MAEDRNSRIRLPSGSRRKTKIDRKAKQWVQQNINKKMEIGGLMSDVPTDTFGEVDFKGATRRTKSKFIRFSDTTPTVLINKLMTKYWHLEKPRLVISVAGGTKSFKLGSRLKQIFEAGLRKIAETPGAWVITGGTNTGVMKHVGEALQGITRACIGISSWGLITKKEALISKEGKEDLGGKFPYHVSCSLVEKGAYLDHNHTHHLMVDDGTLGKPHIAFRSHFEKHIIESVSKGVPAVLLVLNGGLGTLETIYSTVSDDSPISVVFVKGSGRIAEVFAYALNYMRDDYDHTNPESYFVDDLMEVIGREFPKLSEEKKKTYCEKILYSLKKKESFTVFQIGGEKNFDEIVLMALLKGHNSSPFDQLQLTLLWDRADLARDKVFSQLYQWKKQQLDDSMVIALALDRVDFVKLFLQYGISLASILTVDMLEFLYGYQSQTYSSTLRFEFDKKKYKSADHIKYGELMRLLESYEIFNVERSAIPRQVIQGILANLGKKLMVQGEKEIIERLEPDNEGTEQHFRYPYRELFIWAVLNNKQRMAMYLWEFEEGGIIKALIAAELNRMLYERSQKRDLQDELVNSFSNNAKAFNGLALKMLDECYRTNERKTVKLITSEFCLYPKLTGLGIAVNTNDLDFVSHSSVQVLLNEVWTGAIISRETSDLGMMTAYFFPPLIGSLAFHQESSDLIVYVDDDDDLDDSFENDKPDGNGVYQMDDKTNGILLENEAEDPDSSSCMLVCDNIRKPKPYQVPFKIQKNQPQTSIKFHKKLLEFYFKTPVIKFYGSVLSYFIFLILFAYVSMMEKQIKPELAEIAVIVYVCTLTIAEIHQVSQGAGHSLYVKLREWSSSNWNIVDACAILVFFTGLGFRFNSQFIPIGHMIYAIDGAFWVIRLLKVFYVHRVLGPYVVIIYRMTKDILYFLFILLVFLLSYGVCVQSILKPVPPHTRPDHMLGNIIFNPYFNIFGELFVDRDPSNNHTTRFGTPRINSYAETVAWCLLGIYLLITNVLLMNLLIAIFNNTFNEVQENAERVWRFERYGLVIEYYQRVALVAPFSFFIHLYLFIRYFFERCGVVGNKYHTWGLRCSATEEEKESLIEFENSCVSAFLRRREAKVETTLDQASVQILEQIETVKTSIKNLDERIREMEDKNML